MQSITILLVDDHRLIREAWLELLHRQPNFLVIGSAGTADEAIDIATKQQPRIVLIDINMNPVDGFNMTRLICKSSPCSRIIGLSMHAVPAYAKKLFRMGAFGYVTKNSSKQELINAILEVNDGKKYVCDEVKKIHIEDEFILPAKNINISILTKKEMEVAKLVKGGMSSKEIARLLNCAAKTIEVHRYNILKKLKLKNTATLINFINQTSL